MANARASPVRLPEPNFIVFGLMKLSFEFIETPVFKQIYVVKYEMLPFVSYFYDVLPTQLIFILPF